MYQQFRLAFREQKCFSVNQVKLMFPGFDTKNLNRWQKQGYLIKLRNGLYTLSELAEESSVNLYYANRIYKPSYVSLQYALNHYGVIPEFIPVITSVSTLKTNHFSNQAGDFSYKHIKPAFFFGYESKKADNFEVLFASLEKALLDLFYLYPEYNDEKEIENLRFDSGILRKTMNVKKLDAFVSLSNNNQLAKRIQMMKNVYEL